MIDTQCLEQAVRRAPTAQNGSKRKKLEDLLAEQLGIQQSSAHNAGMDAYFTVQALLGLTLKSAEGGIADKESSEWDSKDDGGNGDATTLTRAEYMAYYSEYP